MISTTTLVNFKLPEILEQSGRIQEEHLIYIKFALEFY